MNLPEHIYQTGVYTRLLHLEAPDNAGFSIYSIRRTQMIHYREGPVFPGRMPYGAVETFTAPHPGCNISPSGSFVQGYDKEGHCHAEE